MDQRQLQPPFLSLSPELVLLVCENLQLRDVKQLRLSCNAIGRIADSLVLRNLSISAKGISLDEAVSYLHSLAQSPARYIAQQIVIGDLSSLSPSTALSSNTNGSDELPSISANKEDIRQKIKEALQSLTGVRHVTYVSPIWSTFTGSGIRLEELVHNATPPSLIDYLSTYSGLKKLNLKVSLFVDQSSSNETAIRFFDTVLPRHLDTLENVGLEAYYEGKWCCTKRNATLIRRCPKLNRLLMSIISNKNCKISEDGDEEDDNIDGEREVDQSEDRNMVKHLLDTAIQLPCMSHLSLFPAYPESSRGKRCGTGRMRHYHRSEVEITKKVMDYRPSRSCQYLPGLEVCDTTFEVVSDPDGQLRYETMLETYDA